MQAEVLLLSEMARQNRPLCHTALPTHLTTLREPLQLHTRLMHWVSD